MGRPSEYSDEMAEIICDRIALGHSVREISRMDDMPAMSTVFKWLSQQPTFAERYARAKEAAADALADELLDIADDGTNDWTARLNEDGSEAACVNHEHISRSKLRIDTRKWLLAKLMPKKYGDRVENVVVGQGGGPVVHEIRRTIVDPKAD